MASYAARKIKVIGAVLETGDYEVWEWAKEQFERLEALERGDGEEDARCMREEVEQLCKEALYTARQNPRNVEHPSTLNIRKILGVVTNCGSAIARLSKGQKDKDPFCSAIASIRRDPRMDPSSPEYVHPSTYLFGLLPLPNPPSKGVFKLACDDEEDNE